MEFVHNIINGSTRLIYKDIYQTAQIKSFGLWCQEKSGNIQCKDKGGWSRNALLEKGNLSLLLTSKALEASEREREKE